MRFLGPDCLALAFYTLSSSRFSLFSRRLCVKCTYTRTRAPSTHVLRRAAEPPGWQRGGGGRAKLPRYRSEINFVMGEMLPRRSIRVDLGLRVAGKTGVGARCGGSNRGEWWRSPSCLLWGRGVRGRWSREEHVQQQGGRVGESLFRSVLDSSRWGPLRLLASGGVSRSVDRRRFLGSAWWKTHEHA